MYTTTLYYQKKYNVDANLDAPDNVYYFQVGS